MGEKPDDADSLIRSLLSRLSGRKTKTDDLATMLDTTAQVLALWADVSADETVKHPVSVMASRAASGGLGELPDLTSAVIVGAVSDGIVRTINGIDVTNAKLTQNSNGLYINGDLAVPSAKLGEAVYG